MSLWARVASIALVAPALVLVTGARQAVRAEVPVPAAAKAKQQGCNPATFRPVIDVGHTAENPGAISARGVSEYDFNLRLAQLIEKRLREAGFENTKLLVTSGKSHRTLFTRSAQANSLPADLFLSIHHDSVPNRFLQKWRNDETERTYSDRFKGHSIFISKDNADPKGSLLFASLLGKEMKERGLHYTPHYTEKFMGSRKRILVDAEAGVYRYDQLIVLRTTRMPAVLLEAGLIINRDEELELNSVDRQGLISGAVADAVEAFCAARSPASRATAAVQPIKRLSRH
ncbi:MAG: N-acetylmuramoyl-L-alanine amidase [Xanthobacteraceae bacterium]